MRFKKGDVISIPKDMFLYQCIVCDDETAVFGTLIENSKNVKKVLYDGMFAVTNVEMDDGFKYKIVDG